MTRQKTKQAPTKRKDSATKFYFAICLVGWTAISMIGSQLIIALPMTWLLGEHINDTTWAFVYYGLTYLLALGLAIGAPALVYRAIQRKKQVTDLLARELLAADPQQIGVDKWPTLTDIGLAPIGYVVYLVLAGAITSLMSAFPWFDAEQAQDIGFAPMLYGSSRFIAMIALVLIAPVAEELIMRGWLYGKLREKLSIPIAMLLVAVLFGLLHGQWNVAITTGVLSVILCGLREITGSIWSGVLLHILVNGVAFYVRYVVGFN